MRTSEPCDQVMAAIVAVQSSAGSVTKDGYSDHGNFRFASFEGYLHSVAALLDANGLAVTFSFPDVQPGAVRPTKSGGHQYPVVVKGTIRACHQSGQWAELDIAGMGQDVGDKGIYKAQTGAKKYGLANLFRLTTTDDPESDSQPHQQTRQPPPQNRAQNSQRLGSAPQQQRQSPQNSGPQQQGGTPRPDDLDFNVIPNPCYFVVERVFLKEGQSAKGPWQMWRYLVAAPDDAPGKGFIATFDADIAKAMEAYIGTGEPVGIDFEMGDRGPKINHLVTSDGGQMGLPVIDESDLPEGW